MTVVAYDGQILAADGLGCFGDERNRTDIRKLQVSHTKRRIFGFCGRSALMQPVIAWFDAGAIAADAPGRGAGEGWTLLVVDETGGAQTICNEVPYAAEVRAPFALGSGGDLALGAMHAGVDAREAVAVACHLNVYCGGDIQTIRIAEAFIRGTEQAWDEKKKKNVVRLTK